jgi:hypothetical protein
LRAFIHRHAAQDDGANGTDDGTKRWEEKRCCENVILYYETSS